MSNLQVAQTILAQLGGNRFIAMTGAKNFAGDVSSLSFRLPSTPHFVKDGINSVRITLEPSDTYKVEFFKIRGVNVRKIYECDGIYCDMLRDVFTENTGLETSLGTCRR